VEKLKLIFQVHTFLNVEKIDILEFFELELESELKNLEKKLSNIDIESFKKLLFKRDDLDSNIEIWKYLELREVKNINYSDFDIENIDLIKVLNR